MYINAAQAIVQCTCMYIDSAQTNVHTCTYMYIDVAQTNAHACTLRQHKLMYMHVH